MIIGCIQQVLLKCKVYHIIDDAYICIMYCCKHKDTRHLDISLYKNQYLYVGTYVQMSVHLFV